ncbi:tRNA glutamyl-Q(34) synthetase GluQRS [Segnochrobactrum spirostomi]|uniref:tRNA glutamyl-Q(34) synthetase GluQRS n=1 Tax=Segnochrobactrum spirostomi TaxID=2608987 RepID=A0A6A7Y2A5_9HYPH|nr:tRNA glutamyl-Q(34) synthetase GluQRS [Segnochrobactrum spirostomi]MQT12855.1 tRNA glutamyl-Q(34) synthetase GluQRS [Segnochrobactrum spirostomi]
MPDSPPPPVFRFAPSPNGRLHLGHALSALLNAEMARAAGGRFLLRIEDIDGTRTRPEFEAGIYEDLAWLGLTWESPVRRQSEHFDAYRAALDRLSALGVVAPSYATRREIAEWAAAAAGTGESVPRDPDGAPLFPGDAAMLPADEIASRRRLGAPSALRLDLPAALARLGGAGGEALFWDETGAGPHGETGRIAADPAAWGPVVLARKEVPTSYHLSVVVDDALQGVTHVVRGRDLFAATSVHRLLQALLGLPASLYHHHRLILGDDGRKLSKSRGDTSLAALRAAGLTAAEVRAMVGL